jgi:hypothetical protein
VRISIILRVLMNITVGAAEARRDSEAEARRARFKVTPAMKTCPHPTNEDLFVGAPRVAGDPDKITPMNRALSKTGLCNQFLETGHQEIELVCGIGTENA